VGGGSFPALALALREIACRRSKTLTVEDFLDAGRGTRGLGTPHPVATANLG
jgi:hypothetical protein